MHTGPFQIQLSIDNWYRSDWRFRHPLLITTKKRFLARYILSKLTCHDQLVNVCATMYKCIWISSKPSGIQIASAFVQFPWHRTKCKGQLLANLFQNFRNFVLGGHSNFRMDLDSKKGIFTKRSVMIVTIQQLRRWAGALLTLLMCPQA